MRIMIVTDQYPPMVGGVPRVAQQLATDFAARGHYVWVVAPSTDKRDTHYVEENVQVYRYGSFEWPFYAGQRIAFLPFRQLRTLLKRSDPDVIHLHSPIILSRLAQALGGQRKPIIATNHYLPVSLSRTLTTDPVWGKPFNYTIYTYLVRFCNRCDFVTAPTQTALNLLLEHGLRAPSRAISNGLDLRLYSPGARDPEILRRFHLPEDRPLVLHVNRLYEEKRVDVLLDAAAKLKSDAHIVLVGTGPLEQKLRAQAERLQLGERVSFLGFVEDDPLLALRRSANLFAIPSEADLQSIATMEAMACGLPVIAANSYALPELVHHEENGLLFQPGNSDELARDIDRLAGDPALRAKMGEESLKIIAGHDREKVLDEWEELYTRLANARKARTMASKVG